MEQVRIGGRCVAGFGVGHEAEPLVVLGSDVQKYQHRVRERANNLDVTITSCPALSTFLMDWETLFASIKKWSAEQWGSDYYIPWKEWHQGQAYEDSLDGWGEHIERACRNEPVVIAPSPLPPTPPLQPTVDPNRPMTSFTRGPTISPPVHSPPEEKKPDEDKPDEGISTTKLIVAGVGVAVLIGIATAAAQ